MAASEQKYVNLQLLLQWDNKWMMEEPSRRKLRLGERTGKVMSPSDRLHRLETLAFWRLLQPAARGDFSLEQIEHRLPITLEKVNSALAISGLN